MTYIAAALWLLGAFSNYGELKRVRKGLPVEERSPNWVLYVLAAFWWATMTIVVGRFLVALRSRGKA